MKEPCWSLFPGATLACGCPFTRPGGRGWLRGKGGPFSLVSLSLPLQPCSSPPRSETSRPVQVAPDEAVAHAGDRAEPRLPPVPCCRGTRPSQAAKPRSASNTLASGTAATSASADKGPIPGFDISSRHCQSSRASRSRRRFSAFSRQFSASSAESSCRTLSQTDLPTVPTAPPRPAESPHWARASPFENTQSCSRSRPRETVDLRGPLAYQAVMQPDVVPEVAACPAPSVRSEGSPDSLPSA